jgi:hypothetical protein
LSTASAGEALRSRFIRLWSYSEAPPLGNVGAVAASRKVATFGS